MQRRIAVRGVVVDTDGRLLCVQLHPYHGSIRGDFWCLPGGGLDEGESLIGGITREMTEETGIIPEVGELLYIQQFKHDDTEHLEFFFHIKNTDDYQNIDLGKSTHGATEIKDIGFIVPGDHDIRPEFLRTEPILEKILRCLPVTIISRYDEPA